MPQLLSGGRTPGGDFYRCTDNADDFNNYLSQRRLTPFLTGLVKGVIILIAVASKVIIDSEFKAKERIYNERNQKLGTARLVG